MEGRTANRVGSSDLLSLWGRAYGFDAGGNRTEMVHFDGSTTETTEYEYNDFNQLTITDGPEGVWGYAYDDAGNLTRVYDDMVLNPAEFQHNRENRLVAWTESEASMVGDGQKTAEYVYDAFGRLLWRKGSDGTESRHYYDGINELLVREKPQAGSWRTRYVNALAQSDIGQVLARRTATGWSGGGVPSTWTDRYFHYDTLGNAVMESDHQGEVVAFVDMEAFGNVVAGGTGGPRLTTKWSDPDTGLYYFNARWYDARTGRWNQREPFGAEGPNMYHFVYQIPSVNVDFSGRDTYVATYPGFWGHEAVCFDNGDGSVTCYDLNPDGYYYISGKVMRWRTRLCENPEWRVRRYPRTPQQDEWGRAWGDERYERQDRNFSPPYCCWSFALEGAMSCSPPRRRVAPSPPRPSPPPEIRQATCPYYGDSIGPTGWRL